MRIKGEIVNKIFAQGEQEAPLEACGYLAGEKDRITNHFPLRNVDQSSEHFSLDPQEQFSVIRRARSEGLAILAVYHTHPASLPRPSAEDIKLAYDPNIIYVIASLLNGHQQIKAFWIIKGQVTAEELIIEE
ncbi:MAG: M67 family metallopeptidase [Elusimicrobia bacterium]|nr:M67 family metallopeptidase [Elusimicrobiota bacterium]